MSSLRGGTYQCSCSRHTICAGCWILSAFEYRRAPGRTSFKKVHQYVCTQRTITTRAFAQKILRRVGGHQTQTGALPLAEMKSLHHGAGIVQQRLL